MGTKYNLFPTKWAAYRYDSPDTNDRVSTIIEGSDDDPISKYMVIGGWDLTGIPEADKYKKIIGINTYAYLEKRNKTIGTTHTYYAFADYDPLASEWDETTVCWNNQPTRLAPGKYDVWKTPSWYGALPGLNDSPAYVQLPLKFPDEYEIMSRDIATEAALRYGLLTFVMQGAQHTPASTEPPYIEVELQEAVATKTPHLNTSGGYTPKNTALTLSWLNISSGVSMADNSVVSWKLFYKNGSNAWRNSSGTTGTTATVPATYITADTLEVYVQLTLASGATSESEHVTFSTVEATPTASVYYPKNTTVDGRSLITFMWTHSISTGTKPTQSDLQIASAASSARTWETLATVEGEALEWACPGGTLTEGAFAWRVRTYNTDGTASEWSAEAQITVLAAPATPAVSATNAAKTVITWQGAGQKAYEVRIDETTVAKGYDNTQTYTAASFLDPGGHTVAVRIKNASGFWSEWGEAAIDVPAPGVLNIDVSESANGATLTVRTTSSAYEYFIFYRNDVPIAKQEGSIYTYEDPNALDGDVYRLVAVRKTSGKLYVSTSKVFSTSTRSQMKIRADGGSWVILDHSISQVRETAASTTLTGTYRHFYGSELPVLELSGQRDVIVSFEVAFSTAAEAAEFEQLLKAPVWLKTENNELFYGMVLERRKTTTRFWTSYECTLRDMWRQEAVEI